MKVLILGGTSDARTLAARLVALGFDVTTSLAGVTTAPLLPEGKLRLGGFGGTDGLSDYLRATNIRILIDATHPFAAQMSRHACEAARQLGLPLLRLERPAWKPQQGDNWIEVASMAAAVSHLSAGAHVLVTTGRKHLDGLLARSDLTGVIRVVEPLAQPLPEGWLQVLDRPPYDVAHEMSLLTEQGVTHLLTKNAGGSATVAKLEAARLRRIPVIMVTRPKKPECDCFATVDGLIAALGSTSASG